MLHILIVTLVIFQLQIKWCGQVFEAPLPIVCDLLTETLTSVDPPISDCIDNYLRNSENTVEALIAVKQVCVSTSEIV